MGDSAINPLASLEESIKKQNEINSKLALAEYEKTQELRKQTEELEKTRLSREAHTKVLESLVTRIDSLLRVVSDLVAAKHFDNVENFLQILIPVLSQLSAVITIRADELQRLERLLAQVRGSPDINIGSNVDTLNNRGTTTFNSN